MAATRPSAFSRLFSPLLSSLRPSPTSTISPILAQTSTTALRPFSQTAITTAQASSSKGGTMNPKNRQSNKKVKDMRLTLIRYHMQHPKTPRPLRFSRMRGLRHWTIHRAWLLFGRGRREGEELELQRMYKSMHNACEELRTLQGPNDKDAGRLYRLAVEKKGIYGPEGVPVEYARAQTETPGREAWDHAWTR